MPFPGERWVFLLFSLLLCQVDSFEDCSERTCQLQDKIRLVVVGDTGGIPLFETTKTQENVARQIAAVAAEGNIAAVINLGDNFYFNGVDNLDDPRFKSRFENVYWKDSLPWYVIAGNHDHFGNISAQILHTNRSEKWFFPSLYYNLSWSSPSVSVDLLMLDTISLCGNTVDVVNGDLVDYVSAKLLKSLSDLVGSETPEGPKDPQAAEEQWRWLEWHLNSSRADYLLVAGHYPIYSVASHGPTECLRQRLLPLLRRYGVSAYLAGHDHTLQHFEEDSIAFIVSGAGSRSETSRGHVKDVPRDSFKFGFPRPRRWLPSVFGQLGFFMDGGHALLDFSSFAVSSVSYVSEHGKLLYSAHLSPRRVNPSSSSPSISPPREADEIEILPAFVTEAP